MPEITDTLSRDHNLTRRNLVQLGNDYERVERMRAALLREIDSLTASSLHRDAGTWRLDDLANGLRDSNLSGVVKAIDEAIACDDERAVDAA